MAHKCNTEDDATKWTSEIRGNDDGKLEIKKEKDKGVFSGKHEKSTADLFGRCFEESGGKPHRIWFVVPANNHLYMGHFQNDKKISGKRFVINVDDFTVHLDESIKRKAGPPESEDWVATKT